MTAINSYYSLKFNQHDINRNVHRQAVGGLWHQIGDLTLSYLIEKAKRVRNQIIHADREASLEDGQLLSKAYGILNKIN